MYYKSESETDFGCRGAISVSKAVVLKHELDELRFDISVGDCSWYLRAASVEEREKWVSILESFKKETGSQHSRLRRQGSTVSLSSNTYSAHSANSTKIRHQALKEKIAECETFRDILCRQIETLQGYFDTCSTIAGALHTEEVGAVVSADTVADLMKQHGHEVAVIAIEPVPANNGLLLQRKEFLQLLRDLCDEYGAMLLFDEVISES